MHFIFGQNDQEDANRYLCKLYIRVDHVFLIQDTKFQFDWCLGSCDVIVAKSPNWGEIGKNLEKCRIVRMQVHTKIGMTITDLMQTLSTSTYICAGSWHDPLLISLFILKE